MTQEERELLLKDLSTRLPYGVVCECSYNKENGSSDRLKICSEGILQLNADVLGLFIEDEINLLPYLRPMSSMTEEEKKRLNIILEYQYGDDTFGTKAMYKVFCEEFDLNSKFEKAMEE